MIDGMLVVDVHNHVTEAKMANSASFFDTLGQTPSQLMSRMDNNGIDIAVIFPVNSGMLAHEDFVPRNNFIIDTVQQVPDRFVGFCTVTPLHGKSALDEVRRCVERGLKGIKLHPRKHGGYPLNHEMLDPLMTLARELDIPLLTHTDTNDIQCTPYQARILALRHPEVTLFVAHYGMDGNAIHWVPEVVKDAPNIVLDCSATPDMPYYVFNLPCKIIGAERVVFASDSPDLSPEVNLTKLQVAEELYGLSKADKKKILGENAARILKLKL